MLNEKGFDQWAEDYEQSVALSDADDRYPFAGYRDILDTICRNVLSQGAKDVLDIGFGTGTLSAALYAQGCRIYGRTFPRRCSAWRKTECRRPLFSAATSHRGYPHH